MGKDQQESKRRIGIESGRRWTILVSYQNLFFVLAKIQVYFLRMNWEDVCRYFTVISVCHQLNTSFFSLHRRYFESVFQGLWQAAPTRGHFTGKQVFYF